MDDRIKTELRQVSKRKAGLLRSMLVAVQDFSLTLGRESILAVTLHS